MQKPLILLTNDDGIYAEGTLILREYLRQVGEVVVVVPDRPRSASGHSITLHKPLRVTEIIAPDGQPAFMTNGTPSDCVVLALRGDFLSRRPQVVVSGINFGANLGYDVTYSGTVSAAMEAAIGGVSAVAVSLVIAKGVPVDYRPAAQFTLEVVKILCERPLPPHSLLNINIPHPAQGVQVTRQGVRTYSGELIKRFDPSGRPYYWMGGEVPLDRLEPGTDVSAVAQGYISVTPLHLDLTAYPLLEELSHWREFQQLIRRECKGSRVEV